MRTLSFTKVRGVVAEPRVEPKSSRYLSDSPSSSVPGGWIGSPYLSSFKRKLVPTSSPSGIFLTQFTGWSDVDCITAVAHRIADLAGVKPGVVLWLDGDFKHTPLELFWHGPWVPIPGIIERLVEGLTWQDQITAVVHFLYRLDSYVRLRCRIWRWGECYKVKRCIYAFTRHLCCEGLANKVQRKLGRGWSFQKWSHGHEAPRQGVSKQLCPPEGFKLKKLLLGWN